MRFDIAESAQYNPAWDEFLMGQSAGHHLQSCLWGQLKATLGWEIIRILIYDEDQIVGGAQILTRRLPVWGRIGYISKGPVVAPGRVDVMDLLFDCIEDVGKEHRVLLLSIQPPAYGMIYMHPLQARQFYPSNYYVVPPTTVVVDLQQSEDEILKQMTSKTRYNIRYASRKGVVIREGNEDDLSLFYNLLQMTADRYGPGYSMYDFTYHQEAWRQFVPHDMMRLFLAYYQDELLAASIVIAFGKWGLAKWSASSNAHRNKKPNHFLKWVSIQWAKEKGCSYFDLGGITPKIAAKLRRGEKITSDDDEPGAGIAYYKLGFGEPLTFPGSYDNYYGFRPKWLLREGVALAWKFKFIRDVMRGSKTRN